MSTATSSRIKAACSCGKKYLVRAELSGKRGKCKCGKVFTVPAQERPVVAIPVKKCPWCGARISADGSDCKTCEREAREATERTARETSAPWWKKKENHVIAGICTVTVIIAGIYQTQLNGPEFIKFYFAMGIACCIGFIVARLTSCTAAGFIILLIAFEAIGAIRFRYGLTQGMHEFSILGKMMLFGPIGIAMSPFLSDLLADYPGGGSSGWSGSSCGGGGCGGGGCGGCGS